MAATSGGDAYNQSTRERWSSAAINEAQALTARMFLEGLRYGEASRVLGSSAETVRAVVLGGLIATPSGSDIAVSPGALLQDSTSILPAPSGLVSSYRLGRLPTSTIVTMPSPVADTWYLIEARTVVNLTLTSTVDIWNESLGVFEPTAEPKRYEAQLELQLVTGNANAPAPSGGDWVPLSVLKVPAGGGPVSTSDIFDVRPQVELQRSPNIGVVSGQLSIAAAAPTSVILYAVMDGPTGKRSAISAVDPTSAVYKSPSIGSFTASTWYYLYLCPWSSFGLLPQRANGAGVLVVSDVAPSTVQRQASGAITMPPPWNIATCPAEKAYLVAAIRRNTANNGWVPSQSTDLRRFTMAAGVSTAHAIQVGATLSPPTGDDVMAPGAAVPTGAQSFRVNLLWTGAAATDTFIALTVSPASAIDNFSRVQQVNDNFSLQFADFEIPVEVFGGTTFHLLQTAGGTIDASSIAQLFLYEFSYS